MKCCKEIVEHTLKKKLPDGTREWSRTSLTMATAWLLVIITYSIDFYKEGFRMDAFSIMVGIALGVKWIDSKTKEIEKR